MSPSLNKVDYYYYYYYPNERYTGDEAQVHNCANTATNVTAHGVADITFVNDSEIGSVQMDEFESDSDDEADVYLGLMTSLKFLKRCFIQSA